MELAVLGGTRLRVGGMAVHLRPRERSVLAALALRPKRAVSAEELVDLVWGEAPPRSDRKALQNQLARLRRAAGAPVVETRADGYALASGVEIDVDRFVALVDEARDEHTSPERRVGALRRALACSEGTPFADLDAPTAGGVRASLSELRLEAEEELGAALLATAAPDAVPLLERLVADHPYRERRWWLLVVALYRAGQRQRARQQLWVVHATLDAAGLALSADLAHLDALVAADDPALHTIALPSSAASRRARPARDADVLIGRADERHHLAGTLDLQRRSEGATAGRAVLVLGAEGIGKTSLLKMAAADAVAAGAKVLWGVCDEGAAVPLAPFVQILEQLAVEDPARLAAAAGASAGLLGSLSPTLRRCLTAGGGTAGGSQRRLFDAVEQVLSATGHGAPLLVVVDDLHLAPPTTRLLVTHLAAAATRPSLLCAARPQSGASAPAGIEPYVEVLDLDGFDLVETEEQLRSLLPGFPHPSAVSWMHAQSGGNPLFIRELVRELVERELLGSGRDGTWELTPPEDAPETLRQGLRRHLRALSPPARATLQAAAVLGSRFSAGVLRAMVGDAERAIDEAIAAGIVEVVAPGHFGFRYEVLHRELLDALPDGVRLELHEAAAAALETTGDGVPGEVGRHHLATRSLDPARALASARAAGDSAHRSFAHLEAAAWYRSAGEVASGWLGDHVVACDLAVLEGEALRLGGDPASVEVLLAAASEAEKLGDGNLLARAALGLCQLGPTTEAGSVHHEATRIADRALSTTSDPALCAQVGATASLVHSLSGDQARCRRLFQGAEVVARERADGRLLAAVLPYAYMALVDPDELDRRQRVADELVALGRRTADLKAEWEGHHLRFSVLLQRGDPALDATYRRLVDIAGLLREPVLEWQASYVAAALAHLRGDVAAAERMADHSLELAGAVAASRVTAAWAIQVFALRSAQGRLAELVEPLDRLVREQPGLVAWRAAMAFASAQAGDLARAAREVDATGWGRDLPRDSTWTGAQCALAHAVHVLGPDATEQAETVQRALAPYAGRMSWVGTCTLGPIDTSLAMLAAVRADHDGAQRHRSAALEQATRLDAPLFVAEARSL